MHERRSAKSISVSKQHRVTRGEQPRRSLQKPTDADVISQWLCYGITRCVVVYGVWQRALSYLVQLLLWRSLHRITESQNG